MRALGGQEAACRHYCKVRLDLGENLSFGEDAYNGHNAVIADRVYGGIPHWRGQQHWVEVVVRCAYAADYERIRPALVKATGGGMSLRKLLSIARVMGEAADHTTGQNSRLTVATIMERGDLKERTVKRARTALKLLRVATEVFRGRQRTWAERMASYRVGDKARGWASVWALHPSKPVDKTRISVGDSIQMAPHPRRGHFFSFNSRRELITTTKTVDKRAASRRTETKVQREQAATIQKGAVLASRWLSGKRTPAWAREHAVKTWASVLAQPAAHGWTSEDLNAILDAWSARTHIAPTPKVPAAFLRWLLNQQDLDFPPHVLDQAARDQEAAEAAELMAAADKRLHQSRIDKENGRAALGSPGHRAAIEIAAAATRTAEQRRRGSRADGTG
ncbi:MAG: replication protein [Rhodococcus sp. (in: high G+C Gram-positive bacteria)]|uniref:replication protein n=1 Tax=Rhodococcus sp. TaxID=1831 RepID=UPI003BAF4775